MSKTMRFETWCRLVKMAERVAEASKGDPHMIRDKIREETNYPKDYNEFEFVAKKALDFLAKTVLD